MKPEASPLVSKLTLLVLTLILGCLVLLVYRAYQDHGPNAPIAAAETESITPVEEPASRVTPPPAPAIKRSVPPATTPRPPTNSAPRFQARTPVDAAPAPREPNGIGSDYFGSVDDTPAIINETLTVNGSALLAGMVTLKGTPKPEIPIDLGATCGALQSRRVTTRHFVVGPEGQFANVVVYIKGGLQRKFGPVQPGPLIDQAGCMFEPYVGAVVAGQTFQVRNSDPVLHNIHATPRVNKEFNIGQAIKGQVNTLSFARPEMHIRIKCDVHPWMFTYISVFDHPYFAVTDTNGFFQLPAQIPAGNYVIAASHLKLGTELTQEVTLREGEQRSIQFQFSVPPASAASTGVARSN